MNLIHLTYDSTNYYLVQTKCGFIMIDTGWAGTFKELLNLLSQKDVNINDIKHLIITHFHPDHAGLVQNIKDYGAQLILHSNQTSYIGPLKKYFKPQHLFKEIERTDNLVVSSTESRILLESIGIKGEIIPTPGHSDDSVSLVIDRCCAFTGDLPSLSFASWDNNSKLQDSWALIRNHEVKTIYPGHGNPFPI